MNLNLYFHFKGQSTPAIGFSAILSKNIYLGDNGAIKYDRVLTNIGNGYDQWSGHFMAPVNGLYMFSCTIMAVDKDNISVVMVKNGQVMGYAHSNPTAYDTGAISLVLALKKRDRVWIRHDFGGRLVRARYSSFSGFLISGNIQIEQ